jgi:hypothetical protein
MKEPTERKRKKSMFIVLGTLLVCVAIILIWFHIPYSPLKRQFLRDAARLGANSSPPVGEEFTESDFDTFPTNIQKYVRYCGYIGKPKMSWMEMEYRNVAFMLSRTGPALRIDYTQHNYADKPCRLAFIESSLFGIPFEGYDYYSDGVGGMKGVIGKAIGLFHQTGKEMNEACLVTYLAECLFVPSSLLHLAITFEEVGKLQAKARLEYYGISVSGIFTFNESGEMISFTTDNRAVAKPDGTFEHVRWTAKCGNYQLSENNIKHPTQFQAVWNYPDGDFVYFDGEIFGITYNYSQ